MAVAVATAIIIIIAMAFEMSVVEMTATEMTEMATTVVEEIGTAISRATEVAGTVGGEEVEAAAAIITKDTIIKTDTTIVAAMVGTSVPGTMIQTMTRATEEAMTIDTQKKSTWMVHYQVGMAGPLTLSENLSQSLTSPVEL